MNRADQQIAIIKTFYQHRCATLVKARDERQARIDAAVKLCGLYSGIDEDLDAVMVDMRTALIGDPF